MQNLNFSTPLWKVLSERFSDTLTVDRMGGSHDWISEPELYMPGKETTRFKVQGSITRNQVMDLAKTHYEQAGLKIKIIGSGGYAEHAGRIVITVTFSCDIIPGFATLSVT